MRWLFSTLLLMLVTLPVRAQVPSLEAGDKVRVRLAECRALAENACIGRLEGIVSRTDTSFFHLDRGAEEPQVILFRDVAELDRLVGRTTAFRRGATIGGLVGGAGATIAGAVLIDDPGSCGVGAICFGKGFLVIVAGASGVFYGGLIGGAVGYFVGQEVWEGVEFPQPSLGLSGGALELSFGWGAR